MEEFLSKGVRCPRPPFKRTALLICFAFAVLLLAGGCAGKKAAVKVDYGEALNRWTRSKKIYEGLEARLYLSATYKTLFFRDAYIERYSESYELDEDYKKALFEREKNLAEEYNEFFIAAYTPEENWNDFNQRNSVWKFYLEDSEGGRVTPISITRVESSDPRVTEFFPYLDLWSYGYSVKFPKYTETGAAIPAENAKYLKLMVTGILGKGELEWRLK